MAVQEILLGNVKGDKGDGIDSVGDNPLELKENSLWRIINSDNRFPSNYGIGAKLVSSLTGGRYNLYLYSVMGRFWFNMNADSEALMLNRWIELASRDYANNAAHAVNSYYAQYSEIEMFREAESPTALYGGTWTELAVGRMEAFKVFIKIWKKTA
jgi:hypothetical protein